MSLKCIFVVEFLKVQDGKWKIKKEWYKDYKHLK
jgi:hypothetical protein